MRRKKIVSLCMALTLCLGLLPVTALAADGIDLYVGGQLITESGCYANQDGTWTKVDGTEPASGQFYYDATTFTLTLNQAEISYDKTLFLGTKEYYGSVIAYSPSADVSLNIVVSQETSTITGKGGIRVESTTGNASLSIKGPGSLDVEPNGTVSGITLCSSKNRNLDIDGADVTASSPAQYGVYLISSTDASSTSTITVNNGSLTTGGNGNVGIYYYWSDTSNAGTSSLTVSGNAVVDTRNSKILTNNEETGVQVGAGSDGNGGIVFNGKNGTVYGDVTLQEDLEIGNDETLTIGKDASLTVPDGKTLTNNGTINVESGGKLEGTPTGNGTLKIAPTITTQPQDVEVKENETATFTVKVTGSEPLSYQWQQSAGNGTNWNNISGATSNSYTTDAATLEMNNYQYQCVVSNSAGSVTSSAATLTVNAATVPVTGVSLTPASLSLFTGDTATLTATVQPSNATNQNVTWSSDKPDVATVDAAGKVTAVGAGTATITVTTEDGKKTATCTVTVRPDIPPANPNYRITVEATQGGTVTADPTAAKAGATVTLTPAPEEGYEVGEVTVTDRFGNAVEVTENADGTYTFTMPNGQVSVNVTFVEMEAEPLPFTDVKEGDWFHDAVRYVYDNGLMEGVGDGQFAPNATTNRAMVVTILYRLAGEPDVSGDVGFADVESGLWYSNAVLWAAEKGIVNGISETEFAPAGDLTREQLATVLYRYAESMGFDVSASVDLSGFPDAGDIQSYATQALSWAVAEGLLQGFEDDSLQPGGTATRAQIATILMRFLAAAPTA